MTAVTTNVVPAGRSVSRRTFIGLLSAAGLGALVPARLAQGAVLGTDMLPPGYVASYPDGVMAGDPAPDGAVIWTRLARPAVAGDIPVLWEVATDATFGAVVAGGAATAVADDGYSVKVGVDGLGPDRWYHYRFTAGDVVSRAGRLRTAPAPGCLPERLTFAWVSCQQRSSLYVAHRAMTNEPDLDFVMHLGDYVYVSDGGTISVEQYRGRYEVWKSDPLLQDLQAHLPTVAMWDDGEFYNGVDRTGDPVRLAAARKAWLEHFPVIAPDDDPDLVYRQFAWGDLADIFMLDLRQYRDPAVDATNTTTPEGSVIFDPDRTNLGAGQKQWFKDGLGASIGRWRLVGNSYNFGVWRLEDLDQEWPRPAGVHPNEGNYAPNEAWDDYWAERKELLEFVRDNDIANFVSVSGHTHIWIAGTLNPDVDDPTSADVGFDFTCGSLTADPDLIRQLISGGTPAEAAYALFQSVADASRTVNPWQAYLNFVNHGYAMATVTSDAMVVEFKAVDTFDPDATPFLLARFTVPSGSTTMVSEVFEAPCFECAAGPNGTPSIPVDQPDNVACAAEPPPDTTTTTPTSTATTSTTATSSTSPSLASPDGPVPAASRADEGLGTSGAAGAVSARPRFTG